MSQSGLSTVCLVVFYALLCCYTTAHKGVLAEDFMAKEARKQNLPIKLLLTVQRLETGHLSSANRRLAVSRCGAIGTMQIMPYHAKSFGYKVVDLYNEEINVRVASYLLKERWKKYNGNVEKVLASYNGGGKQASLLQKNRCFETRNYVVKGLKFYYSCKF